MLAVGAVESPPAPSRGLCGPPPLVTYREAARMIGVRRRRLRADGPDRSGHDPANFLSALTYRALHRLVFVLDPLEVGQDSPPATEAGGLPLPGRGDLLELGRNPAQGSGVRPISEKVRLPTSIRRGPTRQSHAAPAHPSPF